MLFTVISPFSFMYFLYFSRYNDLFTSEGMAGRDGHVCGKQVG